MRATQGLAVIFLACLPSFPAVAQIDAPMRVDVSVAAEGELGTRLTSVIGAELRSLGDVTVSSTEPDFKLEVVALESSAGGGGYAASVVTGFPIEKLPIREVIDGVLSTKMSDEQWRVIGSLHSGVVIQKHHVIFVGPRDVRDLAQRIVSNFDQSVLEQERKLREAVRNFKLK